MLVIRKGLWLAFNWGDAIEPFAWFTCMKEELTTEHKTSHMRRKNSVKTRSKLSNVLLDHR